MGWVGNVGGGFWAGAHVGHACSGLVDAYLQVAMSREGYIWSSMFLIQRRISNFERQSAKSNKVEREARTIRRLERYALGISDGEFRFRMLEGKE